MIKYLKLIRLPNLLMVPLTMYLIRYGIIEPALGYGYSFAVGQTMHLQLSNLLFFIIVLINVLLGAAGYVINDYFDRKIDSINRPNEVIIGKTIHRRFAIILHFSLNFVAIVLAAYLALELKKPILLVVYIMIAGIFWIYSTTYKKQFLVGNIIVACGTAMIPLQVGYFDILMLTRAYGEIMIFSGLTFKTLFYWVAAFALFAFLTNLMREIVKDLEDFEGDSSYGRNTLPVIVGINISKIVVIVLAFTIIWLLSFIYFKYLPDPITKWYLLFFVGIPLMLTGILMVRAHKQIHYHRLSWLIKGIMLTGILYALVAKYLMSFNFML